MAELDKINVNGELYDMSDSKARSDIASEITNRTNADNALQEKINTNKTGIDNLTNDVVMRNVKAEEVTNVPEVKLPLDEVKEEIEAAGNRVLNSIPDDYTQMNNDISKLKGDLVNLNEYVFNEYNQKYESTFEISSSTIPNTRNLITVDIPIGSKYTVKINDFDGIITNYTLYEKNADGIATNVGYFPVNVENTLVASTDIKNLSIFVNNLTLSGTDTIIVNKVIKTTNSISERVYKNEYDIGFIKEEKKYFGDTNILYHADNISADGLDKFIFKDLFTKSDIKLGDKFGFTYGNIVGASADKCLCISKQYSDGTHNNLYFSNGEYYVVNQSDIDKGIISIVFQFYPAQGTALPTGTSTIYNLNVIYGGIDVEISFSDKVENKLLDHITDDDILLHEDVVKVGANTNNDGNSSFIYKNYYFKVVEINKLIVKIKNIVNRRYNKPLLVIYFDGNNNEIKRFEYSNATGVREFYFPSNCYKVMVRLYASVDGGLTNETVDFEGVTISTGIGRIKSSAFENLPAYYTNGYLQNKAQVINSLLDGMSANGDSFIFITDEHWGQNQGHSPRIIEYINRNTGISNLISGGDNEDFGSIVFDEELRNSFNGKIHHVVGNHDYFYDTNSVGNTENKLYRFYDIRNNDQIGVNNRHYYYFDNPQNKMRYIVLSAYTPAEASSVYNVGAGYEDEQIEWLSSIALNVEPNWTIVIFTHAVYNMDGETNNLILVPNGNKLINAIDKYNGNGTIACVMQGHTHRDRITHTTNGVPIIITTCDKNTPYTDPNGIVDLDVDRTTGTTNEQAFDVVLINKETRNINLVRIGGKARNGIGNNIGEEVEIRTVSY